MSIHIETSRLILRTPVMEDAAMIAAAMNAVWHDLQLWMSWSREGANKVESIKNNFIAQAEDENYLIGICRNTGQFVISTGMNARKDHDGQHETGYWVSRDFLGKGYATEATNAAIRYGFGVLGVKNVYISHYEGNKASQRVIEKLGFTKTGVREKAHARCLDGTPLDVHEYIMSNPVVLPDLKIEY